MKKFYLLIVLMFLCSCGKKEEEKYYIYENKILELVSYETDYFEMKIPKGWVVSTGGNKDNYAIRVYDPMHPNYQIFSILKVGPILKNNDAKEYYDYLASFTKDENDIVLSKSFVLGEDNVSGFFEKFLSYIKNIKENDNSYNLYNFPSLEEFNVVDNGDNSLRAIFINTTNNTYGEGLFYANVESTPSEMFVGIDISSYNIYNVSGISTNAYDLINYKDILLESLSSLKYKENAVDTVMISNILSETWDKRQLSYDILSQKNNDEELGYIRVYNVHNKKIYKAYKDFFNDYDGDEYELATDEMYIKGIDGYIEK